MFGIQCESCQKYITGKVLEVTPHPHPHLLMTRGHTLAVPAMSPSLKPVILGAGSSVQPVPAAAVIR